MPLHSGTRLLARVVVASVAASLVVSTMQLPGVKRNVAQAAGVATVDSYASFNGTSQYFSKGHDSAFDFTGNITFSAWIRPSSTCFTAGRYCMMATKEDSWLFAIAALRFVIATKAGTCRINVAKRSNGFVLQTISLKVAKTGVLGPDIVAVNEPVTVYFTGGTSNFQKSAAKTLKTTAVAAKNANVVFVGGYTGNVTNDAVNEKLAEVRASKTRSALRKAGVTATIAVMSFGSSGAVTKGKSNAEQNRNRRAVIYIVP